MSQAAFIDYLQQCIWLMVLLSSPILVVTMLLGVLISIFQAVTQIQEQTLTFVPKIMASFFVFVLMVPWMLDLMLNYTRELFNGLATLGH